MDIRDVCSTGPAIAALLQNMARNQLDFDGLILGDRAYYYCLLFFS